MNPERIEYLGEQLRAKIASKFTASTFLAGFALTVLAGQVFMLWQSANGLPPFFPTSVGAVAGAFYLFVQAIARLDDLTMPKLFWEDTPNLRAQPPGDEARLRYHNLWNLHDQMVFFWYRFTIGATLLTALGVLAMLVPPSLVMACPPSVEDLRRHTFFAVIVCCALAVIYCYLIKARARKKFGQLRHD